MYLINTILDNSLNLNNYYKVKINLKRLCLMTSSIELLS